MSREVGPYKLVKRIKDFTMATSIIGAWQKFQAINRSKENDRIMFNKTARTLLCFVLLVALPYGLPGLNRYRLLPSIKFAVTRNPDQEAILQIENHEEINGNSKALKLVARPGEIEDPLCTALEKFFAA